MNNVCDAISVQVCIMCVHTAVSTYNVVWSVVGTKCIMIKRSGNVLLRGSGASELTCSCLNGLIYLSGRRGHIP